MTKSNTMYGTLSVFVLAIPFSFVSTQSANAIVRLDAIVKLQALNLKNKVLESAVHKTVNYKLFVQDF